MGKIVGIVTMNKDQVAGGAPIFIASSEEEREQLSFRLEKMLDATAHDLKNGLVLLVKH